MNAPEPGKTYALPAGSVRVLEVTDQAVRVEVSLDCCLPYCGTVTPEQWTREVERGRLSEQPTA